MRRFPAPLARSHRAAPARSTRGFGRRTRPRGATPARPAPGSGLGTPLPEVTFVVIDLETTGTVPGEHRIIEIGAARYRGGECLGTFQRLVDPGCPTPPFIVTLTGITEALLWAAPPVEKVLPALLDFVGDAVLVGHNLRFDTRFLDAALTAAGRPKLGQARVDTLALARPLLSGQVPDHRLSTLAAFFRTATQPTHRALADARATAEVFHGLLERAAGLGVLTLGDLLIQASEPRSRRRRLRRLRRASAGLARTAAGIAALVGGLAGRARRMARCACATGSYCPAVARASMSPASDVSRVVIPPSLWVERATRTRL